VPAAKAVVVNCAWPLVNIAVPKSVVPLKNCTAPVAFEGDTAAISVTAWPKVEGDGLDVSAVVVETLFTVSWIEAELLKL
jgi:hypothetical protein